VRLALVGCGGVGRKRALALRALGSRHDLLAVCDVDPALAAAVAALFPGAVVASDVRAAVERAGVEAVVVATTHDALAPVARVAIEAGRHVLVEKPAARNLEEVEDLQRLLARRAVSRVVVQVGFNHRYHPALREARRLVDEGALGELLFVRARYGHGGRLGYESEWRANPAVSGGGELVDQGIHLIDLSRWFLGDFARATGRLRTFFWKMPVDDNAFLFLETAGGRAAWLHASCTEWKNLFSFEITGKTGKVEIQGLGGSYGVERIAYHRMRPEMGPPETTVTQFPGEDLSWQLELEDFERTIADGVPRGATLDAAAAAWRVVAAVQAAEAADAGERGAAG
jgi:predicted dehydrogenase